MALVLGISVWIQIQSKAAGSVRYWLRFGIHGNDEQSSAIQMNQIDRIQPVDSSPHYHRDAKRNCICLINCNRTRNTQKHAGWTGDADETNENKESIISTLAHKFGYSYCISDNSTVMVKKCAHIFCKPRKNTFQRVWLKMFSFLVFLVFLYAHFLTITVFVCGAQPRDNLKKECLWKHAGIPMCWKLILCFHASHLHLIWLIERP